MTPSEGRAGVDAIAAAARRVLGADAVLVLDDASRLSGSAGLDHRQAAELERRLGERSAEVLEREYSVARGVPVEFAGERFGTLHALKRAPGEFEHEARMGVFARQAAIALALERTAELPQERLDTLTELDRLVLSAHNLGELSRALTDVLGPMFGDSVPAVMVADPQRNVLQTIEGGFGADERTAASHQVSVFDPRSNSVRVYTTRQPYISNEADGDIAIRPEYVDVFHVERLLTVTLGKVGILHLANASRDYTLDDLRRVMALAPRIAGIVELAMTVFRLRRQQRLAEILSGVAVAVASGKSLPSFLATGLEKLCAALDAGLLAIVPDDGPMIVARCGQPAEELERLVLEEADSGPGIRAYVVGPQRPGDPGWATFYVPVRLGGQRVGTLAALRVRGEPFSQADRRSLLRIANLAALARATERYQQQRAELARMHERQRIADDLHDDVAQILFAAQLSLDAILERDALDPDMAMAITRARGLLIRGDTAIRSVIRKLAGQAAGDLAARLASVVARVEDEFTIAVHLELDEDAANLADLHQPAADALVRVARESLVNVAKHAGPCRAAVTLRMAPGDELVLSISDDGQGSATSQGRHHHGLESLRRMLEDQGWQLRVSHGARGGTTVTATVPLLAEEDAQTPVMTPPSTEIGAPVM
jgi:signal transduction histidine kinase